MKFALKIRKFYLIPILAVLSAAGINSQQYSYADNNHIFSLCRYTFPFQLGIEKSYSITQNNSGILFFSTNKGIITYNGKDWGAVSFNKKCILALSTNKLLVFSDNFTGEIVPNGSGSYLVNKLQINYPDEVWFPEDATSSGDSVYLIANKTLWLFINNRFKKISAIAKNDYLFKNGVNIYLSNNNQVVQIKNGRLLNTKNNYISNAKIKYLNGNTFNPIYEENNYINFHIKTTAKDIISIPVDGEIAATYADMNNNLWVLTDKAITYVKYAPYFKNQGSASYTSPVNETIKLISSLNNNILITTKAGIFEVRNNKPIKVFSQPIGFATQINNKLLFASKSHLFELRYVDKRIIITDLTNLGFDSIQEITQNKNKDFYLIEKPNKIHQLKIEKRGYVLKTIYQGEAYDEEKLEKIINIGNKIYVYTAFNLYRLDANNLIPDEYISVNFPSQGHFIEYLKTDSTGGILCANHKPGNNMRIYYGVITADKINWREIPIWEAGLKNPEILGSSAREVVFSENGSLIRLYLSTFINQAEKVIVSIDAATVNNKKIQLHQQKKGNENITSFNIRYPVNLISLKFRTTELIYPEHIQYSFMLKNKEAEWSNWATMPEKSFSTLLPGDYKLLVKAKTINSNESAPFSLCFTIYSPFYLQWYAWMIYLILVAGLIGLLVFRRKKQFEKEKIKLENIIRERTSELMNEKGKTDQLLANMLPKDTADELKNTGKASSHKFEMVTVLFSDIQGFTKIAEQMNPEKLIDELDNFFFQFDSVVEKYNIEKIKTIGDAYMAAGGIPYKNRTNPVEVVLAAFEMQEYMKTLKVNNSDIWDLRIGIHTGAVIAGVVGHKRLSYDIWGDTVNTASRMESSGEAGKINISGHTYELVKDFFICEYRGKMPVKYKGDIDMYFVKGIRPELSINLRSIPNKKFFTQLQLLRISDLEEFIFNKLETELPKQLAFHNPNHTKEVYIKSELLGRAENISSEEMLIVRTAALFHDTGFIWSYHNHEFRSIEFCREVLPKYKYSSDQIEAISELILCTKKNIRPNSKLEEILIDANTDFLGRIDFIEMTLNLIKERKLHNHNRPDADWFAEQINQLQNHEFYTHAAKKLREVSKNEQIIKLQEHIKQLA